MTAFETFTERLTNEGLTLRPQWSMKREQTKVTFYLIYGQRARVKNSVIVEEYPDGGYEAYYTTDTLDIQDDISTIIGLENQ